MKNIFIMIGRGIAALIAIFTIIIMINVGFKKYDKAPFTVGYMECSL